jgi:hypothetical protein
MTEEELNKLIEEILETGKGQTLQETLIELGVVQDPEEELEEKRNLN